MINLIETYPSDTIFLFYFTTNGFEDVFLRLYAYFGIQIHVDTQRYDQFSLISDPEVYNLGPLFVPPVKPDKPDKSVKYYYPEEKKKEGCLTTDMTRFRSCSPNCECGTRDILGVVHSKVVLNMNTLEFRNSKLSIGIKAQETVPSPRARCPPGPPGDPLQVSLIEPSQRPFDEFPGDAFINSQYIPSKNGKNLLPCHIKYFFSRHSSWPEIYNFIQAFRPKQVYPFDIGGGRSDMRTIKEQFGEVCFGDHPFQYDMEKKAFDRQQIEKKGRLATRIESSHSQDSDSRDGLADWIWQGENSETGEASLIASDAYDLQSTPPLSNNIAITDCRSIEYSPQKHCDNHEEQEHFSQNHCENNERNIAQGLCKTENEETSLQPSKAQAGGFRTGILPLFGNTNPTKPPHVWSSADNNRNAAASTRPRVWTNAKSTFRSKSIITETARAERTPSPEPNCAERNSQDSQDHEYEPYEMWADPSDTDMTQEGDDNEGDGDKGDITQDDINHGNDNQDDDNQGNGGQGTHSQGNDNEGDDSQAVYNQFSSTQADNDQADNNRTDGNEADGNRAGDKETPSRKKVLYTKTDASSRSLIIRVPNGAKTELKIESSSKVIQDIATSQAKVTSQPERPELVHVKRRRLTSNIPSLYRRVPHGVISSGKRKTIMTYEHHLDHSAIVICRDLLFIDEGNV